MEDPIKGQSYIAIQAYSYALQPIFSVEVSYKSWRDKYILAPQTTTLSPDGPPNY